MAGVIEIRVDDMAVKALLVKVSQRLGDMSQAFNDIGSHLLMRVEKTFEREEAPGGAKWTPLAASTQRATKSGKLLQRRGYLLRTVNYQSTPTSASVSVGGATASYAAIHQYGGITKPHVIKAKDKKALAWPGGKHPVRQVNHPGSKIPARPFLFGADGDLPPAWLKAVCDILSDSLTEGT